MVLETLYINNINDKVSLNRLTSELTTLFGSYGKIIQLTANKNIKMKGQAFVTYDNLDSSIKAQHEMNNHTLFSKKINVTFAKANSDTYHSLITKDESVIEGRKLVKLTQKKVVKPSPKKKKRKIEEFKELPPNKVLLLQNIDPSFGEAQLVEHFEKFDGFTSVRLVKVKNLAFVEFEDEVGSGRALGKEVLFGSLTYAKK